MMESQGSSDFRWGSEISEQFPGFGPRCVRVSPASNHHSLYFSAFISTFLILVFNGANVL